MDVYVNGKKVRADPKRAIGKGGEADVFDIGNGQALKLFKPPTHPDYVGLVQEQQAARDRLTQQQKKLRHFPANLPPRIITPTALATDKRGQTILGYVMPLLQGAIPLLKYSERSFRQSGIHQSTVVQIFQDLHDTISKLHFHQVVIGDFNDLNVLVKSAEAYLIDADSFQFGAFPCTMFTARFVDPRLCDPGATQPLLQESHNTNSDWYAFAVMLWQCLLLVDPYGGVYKPKDPRQNIPHAARSLHRITVFHPEVRYPKPAIPYSVLSDELLHYFQQVFEQDVRGEWPRSLLDNLHWAKCPTCGIEYARSRCPVCAMTLPLPTLATVVQGTVTATRVFRTEGVVLFACVEQGQLRWVYHDQGQFRRDDGSVILGGELNPHLRWRIQGQTTFLGYQGQLLLFQPDREPIRIAVDSLGAIAQFDVNVSHYYWISNGQLCRNHPNSLLTDYASVYIGDVLSGQTHLWVGSHFGFGFYQASDLHVAFVFDGTQSGICDRVKLPKWQGQLIHATCTFSQTDAWLFLTTQSQGTIYYHCIVIQANGEIAATAQATAGDEHWLAVLGKANKQPDSPFCAINHFLLAATDDGIVRIELQNGSLMQTKTFSATEPFVDANCRLFPGQAGVYVVSDRTIHLLNLN